MRGKGSALSIGSDFCGITPAHAGKRQTDRRKYNAVWDHPRTCGEKPYSFVIRRRRQGSPPHMRGKADAVDLNVGDVGITPAHAGKSAQDLAARYSRGDHPRTCGEKAARVAGLLPDMGSPPHMRGKGLFWFIQRQEHGITPAHAGKRLFAPRILHPRRDHPRTCGEKIFNSLGVLISGGSPPHMRGKGNWQRRRR